MVQKINRRDALKLSGALALTVAGCQESNPLATSQVTDKATTIVPWHSRPEDHEFFDREIQSFLPDKVFDAHCHLVHDPEGVTTNLSAGYEEYMNYLDVIHRGRKKGAFFIPRPGAVLKGLKGQNEWNCHNVKSPYVRASFLIKGDDDPEWVRQEVKRLGAVGMKCYHFWATKTQPTWQADIPEYLPEPIVKVADDLGLAITLHMVKSRAVADPVNIHWIRHYCKTYPNMKLILAHSARAFQPAHALEGLDKILGFDNLYFDTSANPEPIAHQAILRIHGHQKLLYGTDFPTGYLRGRSVAVNDTFLWLYEDTPVWGEKHKIIKPPLIALESLRSVKWACRAERLTDSQVEDIFWNNAANLFNVS